MGSTDQRIHQGETTPRTTHQSIALPATRSRPCTGKVGHDVRVSRKSGKSTPILGSGHILVDEEQDHRDEQLLLQVLLDAKSTHDEMLFNGLVLGG